MKREVSLYLFVVLLIVGVFLVAYYMNLGITGFVVFQEDFASGQHNQTLYNGSALVVNSSSNSTSGDYTSKVYDAGTSVQWNNLTFTGSPSLTFQVRSCDDANCTNESFASANLSSLNLTAQYFQYKVFLTNATNGTVFLQTAAVEYTAPLTTSVVVTDPSGSKSASTGLSLNYVVDGTDLTCWYNVVDSSDDAVILDNATLVGCTNTTFDLGVGDGSYKLTLYANGSTGFAAGTSTFTIATASSPTSEEEPSEPESSVQVPVTAAADSNPTTVTQLTADDVQALTVVPGSVHEIRWTVRNTGTEALSSCTTKVEGDVESWVSVSDESANLNAGDSQEFSISITIPGDAVDSQHSLTASANCAQTSASKEFSLTVEKRKLGFDIIDAQRTRDDRVRVVYSLQELTGADQNVVVDFAILDASNTEVANSTQNRSMDANATDEFSANIPINESLEGNFSISATVNSEVYTTTVLEPITLGAPVGGFAIFGQGLGTGGFILLIVVVLVVVALIVGARIMRKSGRSLKDLLHPKDLFNQRKK